MKVWQWLGMVTLGMLLLASGCDRSPKDLGKEFHKGKCIVCQRTTMVADRGMNPQTGYSVPLCWRDECKEQFSTHCMDYIDKSKMGDPNMFGGGQQRPAGKQLPGPVAGQ